MRAGQRATEPSRHHRRTATLARCPARININPQPATGRYSPAHHDHGYCQHHERRSTLGLDPDFPVAAVDDRRDRYRALGDLARCLAGALGDLDWRRPPLQLRVLDAREQQAAASRARLLDPVVPRGARIAAAAAAAASGINAHQPYDLARAAQERVVSNSFSQSNAGSEAERCGAAYGSAAQAATRECLASRQCQRRPRVAKQAAVLDWTIIAAVSTVANWRRDSCIAKLTVVPAIAGEFRHSRGADSLARAADCAKEAPAALGARSHRAVAIAHGIMRHGAHISGIAVIARYREPPTLTHSRDFVTQAEDKRIDELIEKWTLVCQAAAQDLYDAMRARGSNSFRTSDDSSEDAITMLKVLQHINIDPRTIRYNADTEEFE